MQNNEWKKDKTTASTCPACGGELLFDPKEGKLKCQYCDMLYTPEEVEAEWAKKTGKKPEASANAQNGATGTSGITGAGAAGNANKAVTREYAPVEFNDGEMKSYSCSTCGAELLADQTTAVMRCPYCGNQTIVEAQFSGSIKPDYIIPFAHTKDQAEEKYKSFYYKRFLLPKSFKTDNHVEEIQGVYVPFWMFSGRVHLDGNYVAYDEEEDSKGNKHITDRYQVRRQGYLDYKNVPADASKRMDDNMMDSVEPYKLEELKDFSMVYLPGFMAERYDVSEEDCKKRAHDRAEGSIKDQVRKSIKHDGIEKADVNTRFEGESTKYALLPVWLLVTKWKDKTYKFAMNGQTGKMIGDLPVSAGKLLSVCIPLFLVIMFAMTGLFGTDLSSSVIAGLVITFITGFVMYSSMKSVSKASMASGYITNPLKLTIEEEQHIGGFKAMKIKREMNKH
ncbi:MAG: hypothetical protein K5886_07110 [Lachnospiraceae bacterium]|nr:hypothetical protein [Lachnospiraceae bacterium]